VIAAGIRARPAKPGCAADRRETPQAIRRLRVSLSLVTLTRKPVRIRRPRYPSRRRASARYCFRYASNALRPVLVSQQVVFGTLPLKLLAMAT